MAGSMFTCDAACGTARVGTFLSRMATPAFLPYTRRGVPQPLIPDNMDNDFKNDMHALHIPVPEFIHSPGLEVLENYGKGIASFVGAGDRTVITSIRDAATNPAGLPTMDDSVTVGVLTNRKQLSISAYTRLIGAFKPSVFVAMFDEVASGSNSKRLRKAVTRSVRWLDDCITFSKSENIPVFGAVHALTHEGELRNSAMQVAERDVSGLFLASAGLGETEAQRLSAFRTIFELSNPALPRLMAGSWGPRSVLASVAAGVDLIEDTYPYAVSQLGQALCFRYKVDDLLGGSAPPSLLPMTQDLRDTDNRLDKSPLVEGCDCFACRRHSRAYIHHLVNIEELLGDLLLNIHNLTWYYAFFAEVRKAIERGLLEQYVAAFNSQHLEEPVPPIPEPSKRKGRSSSPA